MTSQCEADLTRGNGEEMTTMSPEKPTEVDGLVTVRDNIGPLQIRGEVIADLSLSHDEARGRNRLRWTDLTLYQVNERDSAYRYVVQVIGRSMVYHAIGGCRRGVHVSVIKLSHDDARFDHWEPCPDCRPQELDKMGDFEMVSIEEDLPKLHRCKNADEVIQVMYEIGPARRGSEPRALSNLSSRLLQAAMQVDHDIAVALMKTRTL